MRNSSASRETIARSVMTSAASGNQKCQANRTRMSKISGLILRCSMYGIEPLASQSGVVAPRCGWTRLFVSIPRATLVPRSALGWLAQGRWPTEPRRIGNVLFGAERRGPEAQTTRPRTTDARARPRVCSCRAAFPGSIVPGDINDLAGPKAPNKPARGRARHERRPGLPIKKRVQPQRGVTIHREGRGSIPHKPVIKLRNAVGLLTAFLIRASSPAATA